MSQHRRYCKEDISQPPQCSTCFGSHRVISYLVVLLHLLLVQQQLPQPLVEIAQQPAHNLRAPAAKSGDSEKNRIRGKRGRGRAVLPRKYARHGTGTGLHTSSTSRVANEASRTRCRCPKHAVTTCMPLPQALVRDQAMPAFPALTCAWHHTPLHPAPPTNPLPCPTIHTAAHAAATSQAPQGGTLAGTRRACAAPPSAAASTHPHHQHPR